VTTFFSAFLGATLTALLVALVVALLGQADLEFLLWVFALAFPGNIVTAYVSANQ